MTNKLGETWIPDASVSGYRFTSLVSPVGSPDGHSRAYPKSAARRAATANWPGHRHANLTRPDPGRIKSGFWRSLKPTPGELDLKYKRLGGSKRPANDRDRDHRKDVVKTTATSSQALSVAGTKPERNRSNGTNAERSTPTGDDGCQQASSTQAPRIAYGLPQTAAYVLLGSDSGGGWKNELPLGGVLTKSSDHRRTAQTRQYLQLEMEKSAWKAGQCSTRTKSAGTLTDGDGHRVAGNQQRIAIRRLLTALSRSRWQDGETPCPVRRGNPLQPASRSLTLYNMSLYPELNKNRACENAASERLNCWDDWRSQLRVITCLGLLDNDVDDYLRKEARSRNASAEYGQVAWPMIGRTTIGPSIPGSLNGSKTYIKASALTLGQKRCQTEVGCRSSDVPLPAINEGYKRTYSKTTSAPTAVRCSWEDSFCRAPQNTPAPSLCSSDTDDDDCHVDGEKNEPLSNAPTPDTQQ